MTEDTYEAAFQAAKAAHQRAYLAYRKARAYLADAYRTYRAAYDARAAREAAGRHNRSPEDTGEQPPAGPTWPPGPWG